MLPSPPEQSDRAPVSDRLADSVALAIVRSIAASDPGHTVHLSPFDTVERCFYCGADLQVGARDEAGHRDPCTWVRARQLVGETARRN
jgi:hypothetical protein